MFQKFLQKLTRNGKRFYDAYKVLRVMNYLKDLDRLLDECETHNYDAKRRGKLKRYCRLLWHQNVFNDAIDMMKHNLKDESDGRQNNN